MLVTKERKRDKPAWDIEKSVQETNLYMKKAFTQEVASRELGSSIRQNMVHRKFPTHFQLVPFSEDCNLLFATPHASAETHGNTNATQQKRSPVLEMLKLASSPIARILQCANRDGGSKSRSFISPSLYNKNVT